MKLALVVWAMLWTLVAAPWRSFRLRPSLQRVELVPFLDGSPRTQILNVLAFVPLGFIGTRLGWSPGTVALIGAGTSALTELVQLFSTRRHPSITDLILNIAGTLVGIALASSWQGAGAVNAQRPASAPSPKQDP
ncbi:MAG TPA: VanZ family protein [Vicinamibacterales bacterium]